MNHKLPTPGRRVELCRMKNSNNKNVVYMQSGSPAPVRTEPSSVSRPHPSGPLPVPQTPSTSPAPVPTPDWGHSQRTLDKDWDDWLGSLGAGVVRLNLSGHPSEQLADAGFECGDCLHLRHCHAGDVPGLVLGYLRERFPNLDNGRGVVVALPTHIVLRDMLLAAIHGITGRMPTVIYAHERAGVTTWNRRADLQAVRRVARECRGDVLVL